MKMSITSESNSTAAESTGMLLPSHAITKNRQQYSAPFITFSLNFS